MFYFQNEALPPATDVSFRQQNPDIIVTNEAGVREGICWSSKGKKTNYSLV